MSANKTSETVKALTLITILSTPATIIASWYGMNFTHDAGMVELNWAHGYAFAFTLTALTTFGTYWYLKKRGWF
jgi:magnesium transporter